MIVTRRPATSGPSASLQVPYSLAFLRTKSAGQPGLRRRPWWRSGCRRARGRRAARCPRAAGRSICARHAVEQGRLRLEEVLVEVGVGDLPRAERELPRQAAGRVDVGGAGSRRSRRRDAHRVDASAWATVAGMPRHAACTASRRRSSREMSALAAAHRRGQPRPGLPRRRRTAGGDRGGGGGARDGANQYAPGIGIPALRAGDRPPPAAPLRHRARPRHARSSSRPAAPRRSPPRCSGWSTRATRWSSSSPTTTPTSR